MGLSHIQNLAAACIFCGLLTTSFNTHAEDQHSGLTYEGIVVAWLSPSTDPSGNQFSGTSYIKRTLTAYDVEDCLSFSNGLFNTNSEEYQKLRSTTKFDPKFYFVSVSCSATERFVSMRLCGSADIEECQDFDIDLEDKVEKNNGENFSAYTPIAQQSAALQALALK